MAKKPIPNEQRIVLPKVSWQQFETILAEGGVERETRLAYNRGQLEMMTPQDDHHRCNRLIESVVLLLADEMNLELEAIAPILLIDATLQCAAEADEGYYLHHREKVRDQTEIDLTQLPPPDLLVEVAMTKGGLNKLAIYASLGIPEVWRYITPGGDKVLEGLLSIYQLRNGEYEECRNSVLFPVLPASQIVQFITQSDNMGLQKSLKVLRQWVEDCIDS
jgi:Uma2 family endonuclease